MIIDDDSLEKIGEEDLSLPKATLDKLINDSLLSKQKELKTMKLNDQESYNKIFENNVHLKKQKIDSKDLTNKAKKRKYKKRNKKDLENNETTDDEISDKDKDKEKDKEETRSKSISDKRIIISKETKDLIMKSALEFIHLITAEANEICEKDNKKTITHDHILGSLKSLGYTNYDSSCREAYDDHIKINQLRPGRTNKFRESGLTLDELEEQQKALFDSAKQAFVEFKEDEIGKRMYEKDDDGGTG